MLLRKKVLVVEDSEINRMLLNHILSGEYEVLEAENGKTALQVLEKYGQDISLILLDIIMPVMDGYTFLSVVKADPVLSSIPVIVATQSDSEADEVNALAHGAADFVAKPYKPQIILHRVASIINLRETAAMINLVQYDRLTGLYSKEFFYQNAKKLLMTNPDKEYDIICSDIENFKLTNDIFGIEAGDRLLQGIAGIYKESMGDQEICGRFNADQFAWLKLRREPLTEEYFAGLNRQINELPNAKGVTLKWGIYPVGDQHLSVEKICDRALLAARSIKGQYGKHFALYDDKLRSQMLREQNITASMEAALKEEQFQVYLQPKYSLLNDSMSGAEALVRWNHPQWGLQSPADFIPLFEKNGFITKLDQYVWDRTCSFLRKWDDMGCVPISVSVNVSRADLYNADLEQILGDIIKKYDLEPARLHLEITESAYTDDPTQIIEMVGKLKNMGFIIEMDDFGSGYSSLNMLNEMPIDVLKLDMKFIQSETARQTNEGIIQFIISMAKWMSLKVVAEGVETKSQLERLRQIGCDYVQGYYFARPMPEEEFRKLLREQTELVDASLESALGQKEIQYLLVADRDTQYREAVCSYMGKWFETKQAADGKTVQEHLDGHWQSLAAIILDVLLESPDGFSILEKLKKEHKIWNIPVIATGPADKTLEARALELGAEDYAVKPNLPESLERRLTRILRVNAIQQRDMLLHKEAYRDSLTGILNRRGLNAAVEALYRDDTPMAVYMFDMDDLTKINDSLGCVTGDRELSRLAQTLQTCIRESDILARLGGDTFVIVMRKMWSEEYALKKGDTICRTVRESSTPESTACSGGAVLWNMEVPFLDALKQAEQALCRAKNEKRGGCCLWER